MEHKIHIKRAIELANISKDKGEDPFGAVLVRNGEVLHESYDFCKSGNNPHLHAETRLIKEYMEKTGTKSLKDCIVYSSAEPCPLCSDIINSAEVSKVVYSVPAVVASKYFKTKLDNISIKDCKKNFEVIGYVSFDEGIEVLESKKIEKRKKGIFKFK